MGQAQRRKKQLGELYGTPQGSNRQRKCPPFSAYGSQSRGSRKQNTDTPPEFGLLVQGYPGGKGISGTPEWIDLIEIDHDNEIYELIDDVTGYADVEFSEREPDDELDVLEVAEVRGFGDRISDLICDTGSYFYETLSELSAALKLLRPEDRHDFADWCEDEGFYWKPGHDLDFDGQSAKDAVNAYHTFD